MYRPSSRSESFIYEKGSYFDLTALPPPSPPTPLQLPPMPPPSEPPKVLQLLSFLYPFLFHITLISIFESIFFFAYVSTLEDSGIINTIQGYVNPLLTGCWNWTYEDRTLANSILNSLINTTTLPYDAWTAKQSRSAINTSLLIRSWIYVGGFAGVTILITIILIWKKVPPNWKKLLTEQLSMVLLLGAYEWLFFRTIVLQYKAISAIELNQYVVQELDTICNL